MAEILGFRARIHFEGFISIIRKIHLMKNLCGFMLYRFHFNLQSGYTLLSPLTERTHSIHQRSRYWNRIFTWCGGYFLVPAFFVFCTRLTQSCAIWCRCLDLRNCMHSLRRFSLGAKRPVTSHNSSHPRSSPMRLRLSVSCFSIWQYSSSLRRSSFRPFSKIWSVNSLETLQQTLTT